MSEPTERHPYVDPLLDLADDIEDLAALPPAKLALVLRGWLDRQSPDSAEARLRKVRELAIRAVVDAFGGPEVRGSRKKASLALGISEQQVSRAMIGYPSRVSGI